MTKPIKPEDVVEHKKTNIIPSGIIESFNDAIAKNYANGCATVYQDEVLALAVERTGYDSHTIFSNKWFDIEDIYRAEGWRVTYDKPGYNESYRAYFEFRKKK